MASQPDVSRREMLRTSTAVALLSATFPLASCGRAEVRDTVLYVTLTLGNPFYQEMITGLQEGIKSSPGWDLEIEAGSQPDDASGQRDIMESFLSRHLSQRGIRLRGLIIVPANSLLGLTGTIRRYNDANIPIINADIPIDQSALTQTGARVNAFVGSDNVEGGKKAAELMADGLKSGGNILLLMGVPGQASTRDRRDGFIDKLRELETARSVKFSLREWTANWSTSEALTATAGVISSGYKLDGIFAENDLMALGAAQAVGSERVGTIPRPVIIGYDAIPEALSALAEGRIDGTISQNPAAIGRKSLEDLLRIAKGEVVPSREIVPVTVMTRENR